MVLRHNSVWDKYGFFYLRCKKSDQLSMIFHIIFKMQKHEQLSGFDSEDFHCSTRNMFANYLLFSNFN